MVRKPGVDPEHHITLTFKTSDPGLFHAVLHVLQESHTAYKWTALNVETGIVSHGEGEASGNTNG